MEAKLHCLRIEFEMLLSKNYSVVEQYNIIVGKVLEEQFYCQSHTYPVKFLIALLFLHFLTHREWMR